MGVVYEAQGLTSARQQPSNSCLRKCCGIRPRSIDFFFEVRTVSALNHPNICTIYALEKADDQSFTAVELLEGQNLAQRWEAGRCPAIGCSTSASN